MMGLGIMIDTGIGDVSAAQSEHVDLERFVRLDGAGNGLETLVTERVVWCDS